MFSFFKKKSTPAPVGEAAPVPSRPVAEDSSGAGRTGWLDKLRQGLRRTGSGIAQVFTGTRIDDAPIVVALGPGFTAGVDCHAVVETNRGHHLGRVYYSGSAQDDTGTPGKIGGEEAKRYRHLARTDGITLNRDRLLYHAKQRALGMARAGFRPPRPLTLRAAGYDIGRELMSSAWGLAQGGFATAYDAHIANKVAHVLCGGNVAKNTELAEQHYLDLEREAFLSLCGEEKTQARIEQMLTTGKPLRN